MRRQPQATGVEMSTPPPEVAAAAAVVQRWLDTPVVMTAEEIGKMSARERINYCRQFDQSKMPGWKDPRSDEPPTPNK
jgi:hypothetical protein